MEDNKTFEKLLQLQQSLVKKFALEREIEDLPRNLKAKKEDLASVRENYEAQAAECDYLNKACKDLSFQYESVKEKREASEKKMENITTQREFEALEKEINDAAEKEKYLLRERQNTEQISVQADENLSVISEQLEALKAEVADETSHIEALQAQKRKEFEVIDKECANFVDGTVIDDDLYEKFSNIVKHKDGLGIVAIHDLVCQGCHVVLPRQFVNDVRSRRHIEFCPYCSRILFYEDPEKAQVAAGDENGAELTDFVSDDEFDDIF